MLLQILFYRLPLRFWILSVRVERPWGRFCYISFVKRPLSDLYLPIWRFFLFFRLKVLNINTIESGLKVECQMETAKQKTITFEFSTVDFVPEDISNEFVKEVMYSSN